jgi:hypothetical protein
MYNWFMLTIYNIVTVEIIVFQETSIVIFIIGFH